jgi:CheY-like chemotaxis protein
MLARMLFRPLVLCVDDEPLLTASLSRLLRRWGAQVLTASHGREALEVLARTAVRPDLIITDLKMPVLDGDGLIRALRLDPALAAIPVAVLSASRTEERASAYLPKPFTSAELRAVFEALCPPTQLHEAWGSRRRGDGAATSA